MSEAKAKSTENKAKSANQAEKSVDVVTSSQKKVEKLKWTLERCKKYARRFPNEAVWASCHSSSYKAAVAHGWKEACLNQSSVNTSTGTSFKKAA